LKVFDLVAISLLPSNISEKIWQRLEEDNSICWGENNSKKWQKPGRLAYSCTELPNHSFSKCKDGVANWSDICRQHLIQQRRQSFFGHNSRTDPCRVCYGLSSTALLLLSIGHITQAWWFTEVICLRETKDYHFVTFFYID